MRDKKGAEQKGHKTQNKVTDKWTNNETNTVQTKGTYERHKRLNKVTEKWTKTRQTL